MKNKLNLREFLIIFLTSVFAPLIFGLAGDFENPHFTFKYLLFFFTWLGMFKFITGLFDIVSPNKTKEKAPDPRDAENKAIVKEFFK